MFIVELHYHLCGETAGTALNTRVTQSLGVLKDFSFVIIEVKCLRPWKFRKEQPNLCTFLLGIIVFCSKDLQAVSMACRHEAGRQDLSLGFL